MGELPQGATFSSEGILSGTVIGDPAQFSVLIIAENDYGEDNQELIINLLNQNLFSEEFSIEFQ